MKEAVSSPWNSHLESPEQGDTQWQLDNHWRAIIEALPEGVAITDLAGRYLYSSAQNARVFGLERGEALLGHSAFELIDPSDHEWARVNMERTLECGVVRNMALTLLRVDGSRFQGELTAAVLRDHDGTPFGFVAVTRDISSRHEIEQALEDSRSSFQDLVEASGEGIVVTSPKGVVRYLNSAASSMLGVAPRQTLGRQLGIPFELDEIVEHELPGDEPRILSILCGRTSWQGEPAYLLTLRDVTRLREAERVRAVLEEQVSQNQRVETIGLLAAEVFHDLNNILQAILGNANLAMIEAQVDEGGLNRALDEIVIATQRAALLVRQILDLGRRPSERLRTLDLNVVVDSLLPMIQHLLPEEVELCFDPDDALGVVVGDAGQLGQILLNLCVNARDAITGDGRITIATRDVTIAGELGQGDGPSERCAQLTVTDSGRGIPPEALKKVFHPFFTTKEPHRGTGLGLSTVKRIVTRHGGDVRVESTIGRGTTFEVLLPARQGDAVQLDGPGEDPRSRSAASVERPPRRVCR